MQYLGSVDPAYIDDGLIRLACLVKLSGDSVESDAVKNEMELTRQNNGRKEEGWWKS